MVARAALLPTTPAYLPTARLAVTVGEAGRLRVASGSRGSDVTILAAANIAQSLLCRSLLSKQLTLRVLSESAPLGPVVLGRHRDDRSNRIINSSLSVPGKPEMIIDGPVAGRWRPLAEV